MNNGDSVQLNCYVNKGDTPIQISWLLNDKPIEYDDVSMVPFGGRTNILTIGSVQAHHMGNYTCKAENRAGFSTHLAILLVNGNFCVYNAFKSYFPSSPTANFAF